MRFIRNYVVVAYNFGKAFNNGCETDLWGATHGKTSSCELEWKKFVLLAAHQVR